MADRGGLENRCTGNRTVGSNPTPSATHVRTENLRTSDIWPLSWSWIVGQGVTGYSAGGLNTYAYVGGHPLAYV